MRRITAILLCIAMVLSLAACGSEGSNQSAETVNNSTEQNTSQTNESSNSSSSGSEKNETEGGNETPAEPSRDTSDVIDELVEQYASLKEDQLKWEYNSSSRTIVISGEGPMRDYSEEAPEWDQYSTEAECVVIGDKVTSVGAGAFLWFSAIREVKLGESVEFIDFLAFSNCDNLWTVNFPDSLKYIGAGAFNNSILHSDSGFTFPDGVVYIGEEAFRSAFKENAVNIPASVLEIGEGAFANTYVSAFAADPENLSYTSIDGVLYDKGVTELINYPALKEDKEFEVPGTVTEICEDAFEVNSYLEKLIIPASVSEIEEGSVFWNYALNYIDVDDNNSSYKSVDGVLFTKDGKELLSYPIASGRTEYTIPEGTEKICEYAMSQAVNLTALHTSEGLKEIGESALYLCQNLVSAGLPKSLEGIEEFAFLYCDSLKEINYAGSGEDWQGLLNSGIEQHNDPLFSDSIDVHCVE